jgi:hypothetical protein
MFQCIDFERVLFPNADSAFGKRALVSNLAGAVLQSLLRSCDFARSAVSMIKNGEGI